MRIVGHGVDAIKVERIKELLSSKTKRWEDRAYTVAERDQSDKPPVNVRYFAGRFAAKEAVAKALGTGFAGDVSWSNIEILRGANGAPSVRLTGGALARANELGVTEWFVSISHSEDVTVASVIAVASESTG